jgi:hypothetical protein
MNRLIRGSLPTARVGIVMAVLLAGYGQKDDLIAQTAKEVAGIKLDQATGDRKSCQP